MAQKEDAKSYRGKIAQSTFSCISQSEAYIFNFVIFFPLAS